MSAFFDGSRVSLGSLARSVIVGGMIAALSAIGLSACGSNSGDSGDSSGNSADRAANRTTENGTNPEQTIAYARILWEIERERDAAYDALTAEIASDKLPPLNCDQPKSLKVLRGAARDIAVGFCNTARDIVERARLTSDEFNELSRAREADPTIRATIEAELLRIQADEAQLSN